MSSSVIAGLSLETVLYEKKTGIAYITLNRPKVLNALNKRAIADLKAAFEDARDDSEVHGVILTGAGDKAFIAGADINEVATDTPVQAEEKTRRGQELMTVFLGGARDPETPRLPDGRLVDLAVRDLEAEGLVRGAPSLLLATRWERSIPQYTNGHASRMEALARAEARWPGLRFAGNYRSGISVGDVVKAARAV